MNARTYLKSRNKYRYPAVGLQGSVSQLEEREFPTIRAMEEHHRRLLRSKDDANVVVGYLSVLYWGHYSGQDQRSLRARALARVRLANNGVSNLGVPKVAASVRTAIDLLDSAKLGEALVELSQLPQLKFAFASKVCAFILPEKCGVVDSVIADAHRRFEFAVDRGGYVRKNAANAARWGGQIVPGHVIEDYDYLKQPLEADRQAEKGAVEVPLLADVCATKQGEPLAAHRERQRSQSSFRNLALTLDTGPVLARVELVERVVDARQRFRAHLEESEPDFLLNVGLRVFEVVTPILRSIGAAIADWGFRLPKRSAGRGRWEGAVTMTESEWGLCEDCKWWQIEPRARVSNTTMGLCIDEDLQAFRLRVSGNSGCTRFMQGKPARAKGSSAVPPTAQPTR